MIHHNGDKAAREYAWPQLWLQPQARQLMHEAQQRKKDAGGAYSDGKLLAWDELCPAGTEAELYRDV